MGYFIVLITVFLLAIFLGFSSGCKKSNSRKTEKQGIERAEKKESPARANIRQRLSELSQTSRTYLSPCRTVAADCYFSVGLPEKAEYICPKCNEKTLYWIRNDPSLMNSAIAMGNDRYVTSDDMYLTVESIMTIRRIVENIRTVNIELDETQFCKKCSPKVETPKLSMIMQYEGEKEPYRVGDVTLDDIMLLKEFFSESNKKSAKSDNSHVDTSSTEIPESIEFSLTSEREIPIETRVKRLSELLSVEIELPEKDSK